MKKVHKDPSLESLIQETAGKFHAAGGHNQTSQMKVALRGGSHDKSSDAFDTAIGKLNEMTEESQANLDAETQRCSIEIQSMETEMAWLQDQVKRHNADAASARAAVLIAQGNIATLEELLRETSLKFEQHKRDCIRELNELNAELSIVLEDVKVMATIIGLIDCSTSGGQRATFV